MILWVKIKFRQYDNNGAESNRVKGKRSKKSDKFILEVPIFDSVLFTVIFLHHSFRFVRQDADL